MKYSPWIVLAVISLVSGSALAGCYSDWCAGKRSGSTSSGLTQKYGGTYSQSGSNYLNYSRGFGSSGGNGAYYSPYYYGGPAPAYGKPGGVSPAQQAEIDRLMKKSDALIDQINRDMQRW